MKYIVVLFMIPIFMSAQSIQEVRTDVNWYTDYDKAIKQSKKQNKNLLVYFTGSDWCAPCKKLKTDLFATDEFKTLSDDYILLYIDIPMNKDLISTQQLTHNKALLPRYNKKNVFPLLKVIDPSEKELGELSGYSMNGEIQYHLNLLKKHRG